MRRIQIREARPDDTATILQLITELAIYEKAEDKVLTDEAQLRASLFADDATAHGLICEVDGEPVGYAVYFFNFSTWLGRNGLYLEDLYISPAYRQVGAGKALLKHLAQQAVARGCGRFEWSVLDWNTPAIGFYESIGAEPQNEWVLYRLTGDALVNFANS
ncbi:GCN5 family acetyltransferase [Pokkaliibacter plantistimulans]|uniref:GCN5 family acetyltransferase n=1 Tax=Pokkaliibacter plantistimulans TaxID=1635171 RepID=A0ABX5M0M1_9GAMM|nr:GNAT family N-acetyltransferase [Pokkaliibacter plantistimulans]PXF31116.1 GCN5 family acetyltransferase [Pokkaliibacter plantistimulans]